MADSSPTTGNLEPGLPSLQISPEEAESLRMTLSISFLTELMSEGDLPSLQLMVMSIGRRKGQEHLERAYRESREMFPQMPSLRELMAWDRQNLASGQSYLTLRVPDVQLEGKSLG